MPLGLGPCCSILLVPFSGRDDADQLRNVNEVSKYMTAALDLSGFRRGPDHGHKPNEYRDGIGRQLRTSKTSVARSQTYPASVREEAGRELIRLTVTEKSPVAKPTPQSPYSEEELQKGWIAMMEEAEAMRVEAAKAEAAKPKPEPVEPEPVEVPRDPEPVERERGSIWPIGGISYMYMAYEPESKMHLLSQVNSRNIGMPQVERFSEDRLTNKKYAPPPRTSNCPTDAEVRAMNMQRQNRLDKEWRVAMGLPEFGDLEGWK